MAAHRLSSLFVVPLLVGVLGMGAVPHGWAQQVTATVDSTESVIDYTGSATMHDWTGTSRDVSGTMVIDPKAPESSRAVVRVTVATFESGPDRRDRKMREVTEAEKFPIVEVRTKDIEPVRWGRTSSGHAGRWDVTTAVTFHGQTHPVDATVDVRVTEDSVHAHAQFPVSLTRFGVKRPRLLWVDPIADTIRIDARVVGAIHEPATAGKRLDTSRSDVTGTRRIASSDLRDVPPLQYDGTSAGLHASARMPSDAETEWLVALYGFAEEPTGLADAKQISLRADRTTLEPRRSAGTKRRLDDGTSVEIIRMYFSRSEFETLARALTVSATVGSARFSLPWRVRRDLRLIVDEVSSPSPGRVSSNEQK